MTQKELDELYRSSGEDIDKFGDLVSELGGVIIYNEDMCNDDIGGIFGLEDLFELVKDNGFAVLNDPTWDNDVYGGQQGWVIFPPKKG